MDFDGYAVVERRADGSHRMVTWGQSRQAAWAQHVRQAPRVAVSSIASINTRRAVRCSQALGFAARQAVDVGTIEVEVSGDGVADLAAPPAVVPPPPPASAAALRAPVPRPRSLAVLAGARREMDAAVTERAPMSVATATRRGWISGLAWRDGRCGMLGEEA